jgi:hypothetical protein
LAGPPQAEKIKYQNDNIKIKNDYFIFLDFSL